jgi:acetyl esterase/lipase
VRGLKVGAATVALIAGLTACGTDAPAAAPALAACPAATPVVAPPGGVGAGGIAIATSVAPGDTSTSTVVTPGGGQIRCGRTGIEAHNDVEYSPPLKMDVLVPKTAGLKPLVVYLSGGGFVAAGKEFAPDLRTYVAEQGFVVASIQYRTVTTGNTYVDGVADAKSAIRYLRANAAGYGIDPARVAVWGESAGGYLASMAGTTNGDKRFDVGANLGQSSDVQAVVDKFGPSDLSKIAADFDPAAQEAYAGPDNAIAQYVNGPKSGKSLKDDPEAVASADPVTHIDGSEPAFLEFHGSADNIVSPSQTLLLHNALRSAGVDSTRYVLDGAGHGDLAFAGSPEAALGWSTTQVMGYLVDFLNTKLR